MRLIDDGQVVIGEIVQQASGTLTREAPIDVTAVVLHPSAGPHLQQHVDVESRSGLHALRFQQFPLNAKLGEPLRKLCPYRLDGPFDGGAGRDVVRSRIHRRPGKTCDDLAPKRVDLGDAFNRVAPQLDPHCLLFVRGEHLDGISSNAERTRLERDIVAVILNADQILEDGIPRPFFVFVHEHHSRAILRRTA
jgi:hypothetical protein